MKYKDKNRIISLIIATIGLGIAISMIVILRDPALALMYRTFILLDIFDTTPNKTAIEYLYKNGVVEGYPDHTFRPAGTLNRAEFTTLIVKATKRSLSEAGKSCFPDTPTDQWYNPYVCAARDRNWVQGYPDGSFRPGNKIKKTEAIAILCRAQNWQTKTPTFAPFPDTPKDQWYTPCLAYAQEKNFLEEQPSADFHPSQEITRGAFGEILFRTLLTLENNAPAYKSEFAKILEKEPAPADTVRVEAPQTQSAPRTSEETKKTLTGESGDPYQFQTYQVDFFDNIILREPLPNRFYKNEIYMLEGHIQNGDFDTAFAFLNVDGKHQNFVDEEIADNRFSLPLFFEKTGNYSLGIIPGSSGTSKLALVSVVDELPQPETLEPNDQISDIMAIHENDITRIAWNRNGNNIVKITFSQGNKEKSYFMRQDPDEFETQYKNFYGFLKGEIKIKLEGAKTTEAVPLRISSNWSTESEYPLTAALHYKSAIENDEIEVENFTNIRDSLEPIAITATTKTKLNGDAAVIKPDGFVTKISLETPNKQNGIILENTTLTLRYTPAQKGTYMLEINNKGGSAVFNVPFYVQDGIPLIPTFFDLYDAELSQTPVSLDTDRTAMLALINEDRTKYGLAPVKINDELSLLAQNHTNDMAQNNFFGHYNLQNQSPDDRRKNMGIQTQVGENLAKSPTLVFAEEGLLQSAVHRENILESKWTRVGIGITKDTEGYLLVAQEFSTDKLTSENLTQIADDFLKDINEKRSANAFTAIGIDAELDRLADAWSQDMADRDYFSFETPEGNKLLDRIRALGLTKAVQALILEGTDAEKLQSELTNQSAILDEEWRFAGIGIAITRLGTLKITLLYTP